MRILLSPFPFPFPLLFLFLTAAAPATLAQVYKCEGSGGVPVYQDAPCPDGRELRNFATDPATVSVLPMPPAKGSVSRQSAAAPVARTRATSTKEKPVAIGNAGERRYLAVGMQEGEVLARAGKPDMKSGGGGRKLARWTYMPAPGDPQTLTTIVFEYGKVVEVERKVVR